MSKFFKVAVIGSGNVAWHLARALEDSGHFITDIYSRRLAHAEHLATRLYDTQVTDSLDFSASDAEIFLIAVTDDAVENVAANLRIPPYAIVAHTSGTQSLVILSNYHENCGVFYPVQTFSKGVSIELKDVPICIEAVHRHASKILTKLAQSISNEVIAINSEDRKVLHVAAVFACNFSNHMLSIAQDILEDHDMDFEILQPLIVETINKALTIGPMEAQTGPAKRGDSDILQEHVKFLKYDQAYKKIYKLLSDHLKQRYT